MYRRVRGDTGHEAGNGAVDQLKLVAPLPGLAAMDVPHLVKLSPVEIDEGTLAGPNCRQRRIHPSVKGVRRGEGAAAQRRVGQSRTVEEACADAGDSHAAGYGSLEHCLARLPQARTGCSTSCPG